MNNVMMTAILAGICCTPACAATPSAHTGFSVGANVGYKNVDGKLNQSLLGLNQSNFGATSPVAGLFLGYGWAPNPSGLYLGAEIFGQFENINAKREDNAVPPNVALAVSFTTKLRSSNTFGAAARVGYLCKEALFFVKLGAATSKWKLSVTDNEPGGKTEAKDSRRTGFLAGIGMDYAIARNWAVGGEFTYTMYGKVKGPEDAVSFVNYKPNVGTVSVRLKYAF